MKSNCSGGKHVVKVVTANEVRPDLMPRPTGFMPAQAQERVTCHNLATNTGFLRCILRIENCLNTFWHDTHQMRIVGIDEDDTTWAFGKIGIQFTLGVHDALK